MYINNEVNYLAYHLLYFLFTVNEIRKLKS